jgi:hypothetical protein
MKKSCLVACVLLACAGTARADVISDWNIQTGQRIGASNPPRRGPSSSLDVAMVHLAMHDAVQAFDRRYEPYCAAISSPSGSPVAAAAKAARDVLVGLFGTQPGQTAAIDTAYGTLTATYISEGLMVANDDGEWVGAVAAACILDLRFAEDEARRATPDSFRGGSLPGEWRPTVPSNVAMAADFMARTTPFAMKTPDQFRMANPSPHLTSGAYTKAYNEVKEKGASDITGHTRTPEETQVGRFFAGGPGFYWSRLQRDLVVSRSLDLGDSARMFALVAMTTADALIAAWDTKIAYNVWRPVTAIRDAELDGNPDTLPHAGPMPWTSLFNAPNYPDYTSGANNVAAATATTLAYLLGDKVEFTLVSDVPGALPRPYTSFSDVCRDVVDARIFMGIHFRFADTTARRQGDHVAMWGVTRFLRPIGGSRR